MDTIHIEPASYRDPSGHVFVKEGRIFRTVMPQAKAAFDQVRKTALIDVLIEKGWLLGEERVSSYVLGEQADGASYVLEHPHLSMVTYPYEWTFSALKAAALRHLDIQLMALDHGVTLSDASAYNMQYQGAEPVFIDHLSFKLYEEGEFWLAHKQFCEQFLNPLLLQAKAGIAFNEWYRGSSEGISTAHLSRILRFHQKCSWNMLVHVVLPASLQKTARQEVGGISQKHRFPRQAFERMLRGLHRWISRLEDKRHTKWSDYEADNTYSIDSLDKKRAFIAKFIAAEKPDQLWDLGCNTGMFSSLALEKGAGSVVGIDGDEGALEQAFKRATANKLSFLPLCMDLVNASPSQGWMDLEHKSLLQRAPADACLALALVHHMAITQNIPLPSLVSWLYAIAPTGVVEFVPKTDPMVQGLLALREDIFDDYTEEHFIRCLESQGQIIDKMYLSSGGRCLFYYKR